MQFTPKTEKQIQEERCIPEGEYDFECMAAEDKRSKNGNDMIEVTLHVFREDGSHLVLSDYLLGTDKMAWKLRHFCDSCGILDLYDAGELNAFHCRDVAGRCKVVVQDDPQYGIQNKIKDYVCLGPGQQAKPVERVEVDDEGCPF